MVAIHTQDALRPVTSRTVSGGDGVTLQVDETGNPDGKPILFIHGGTSSRLAWDKQLHSDLADEYRLVALDLRGHGESDKPEGAYEDSRAWADDIHSVITDLDLDNPVLVGWSWGGIVTLDYIKHYGTDDIAGVNFAGAIGRFSEETIRPEVVQSLLTTDPEERVERFSGLIRGFFNEEISPQDLYFMLGFTLGIPQHVIEDLLLTRTVDHSDVLSTIDVPTLVSTGTDDPFGQPGLLADGTPTAELSEYPGVGHLPFWVQAERFNTELDEFVADL